MTEVYALRHLLTPWNEKGMLQGHTDISISPISDDLKEEISEIKKKFDLKPENFDKVYVSPLKRTHETAQAFGFNNFEIDSRLMEVSFGSYEGRLKKDLIQETGSEWLNNPKNTELWKELLTMQNQLEDFLQDQKSFQKIMIFAHGGVLRYFDGRNRGLELNQINTFRIDNGQLIQFHV